MNKRDVIVVTSYKDGEYTASATYRPKSITTRGYEKTKHEAVASALAILEAVLALPEDDYDCGRQCGAEERYQ